MIKMRPVNKRVTFNLTISYTCPYAYFIIAIKMTKRTTYAMMIAR